MFLRVDPEVGTSIKEQAGLRKVASCAGLITQKAYQCYQKMSPSSRAYQDLDDVIQTGYIEAARSAGLLGEGNGQHDDSKPAKYSTFLYKGLWQKLSNHFLAPQRTAMRSGNVVSLSSSLGSAEEVNGRSLADVLPSANSIQLIDLRVQQEAFKKVFSKLSSKAATLFAGGILCGTWDFSRSKNNECNEALAEIRGVCSETNVSYDQFAVMLSQDKKVELLRKKLLQWTARSVTLNTCKGDIEADQRILQCVTCNGRLFLSAIVEGRYDVDTMTCTVCLTKLRDTESNCFGKKYSGKSVTCSSLCNDSKACKNFKLKKDIGKKQMASEKTLDLGSVDLSAVEAAPVKKVKKSKDGKSVEKSSKPVEKSSKSSKAPAVPEKKSKKSAAPDDEKPNKAKKAPKEDAEPLPFKASSAMRAVFVAASAKGGVSLAEAATIAKKRGAQHPQTIVKCVIGQTDNRKYKWNSEVTGDRLVVTNLRTMKIKKAESEE